MAADISAIGRMEGWRTRDALHRRIVQGNGNACAMIKISQHLCQFFFIKYVIHNRIITSVSKKVNSFYVWENNAIF
jgi:hypothetical protein